MTSQNRENSESITLTATTFSMCCLPKTIFEDGKPRSPEQILSERTG
jgi:hypothetical protein